METPPAVQEAVDFIPFISLYRTWNQGIAFSMLWGLNDLALIVITLGITGFVAWLASRTPVDKITARLGFMLIVAGAIGNLIDRTVFGHVVDYILFQHGNLVFCGVQPCGCLYFRRCGIDHSSGIHRLAA